LIRAGNAARDRKDWPEAIRLYQLAVEKNPSLHRIHVQLGHAHKESGDLDNAARAYYTVLKHAPLDDDLHLQIGHLEKLRGNTQRAAAAYQKSAQLNPRNAHAVAEYLGLALPAQVEEIMARELAARVEAIVAQELPERIEQAVDRILLSKQSQIFDQEISRRSFRPNDIVAGSIVGEYMAASNAQARDFFHPAYEEFCRIYKEPIILHRKSWEWAFIYDRLSKAGVLRPGSRGLGFGVGTEKLPAFFAALGVHITATDAPAGQNWDRSSDASEHKNRLFKPEMIDHESFDELVSFEYCDMNDIPRHLTEYDFCWSSCSLEHLGSLQHGIDFIVNSIERNLKVGGVACHTTELNLTSDDETLETGVTAIYRKKDLQKLCGLLEERGHRVEPLRIEPGTLPPDYFVDVPPYPSNPHLKLLVGSYVTTSVGIVACRGR
jgi:tetratricopeptide (TPR) repeat protein